MSLLARSGYYCRQVKPETSRLPWEVDHHRQVCLCLFPPRPPRRLPLPGEDPDLNVYLALVQPGHHQATSGAYRTHSVWRGRWWPRRRNPKKTVTFLHRSVYHQPFWVTRANTVQPLEPSIFLSWGNNWAGLLKKNKKSRKIVYWRVKMSKILFGWLLTCQNITQASTSHLTSSNLELTQAQM